jgi:hypothetical protein
MAFEIVIPQAVHDKVMHWVRKTDKEVSGFGKVTRDPETGIFRVVDAYLLEQEVGAAHTDIDDKSLSKLMYKTKDIEGDLAWWWHSHVNMSVFWSATDKETILELGANGWIVASVFNKSEDVRSALAYKYDYASEFGSGTNTSFHDEIETTIELFVDTNELESWDKEFDDCVRTEKTYVTSYHGPSVIDVSNKAIADGDKARQLISEADVHRKRPYSHLADEEYWEWGLLGYGIEKEASVLGMSTPSFYAIIDQGDLTTIRMLEGKLDAAVRSGKLTGEPYNYATLITN